MSTPGFLGGFDPQMSMADALRKPGPAAPPFMPPGMMPPQVGGGRGGFTPPGPAIEPPQISNPLPPPIQPQPSNPMPPPVQSSSGGYQQGMVDAGYGVGDILPNGMQWAAGYGPNAGGTPGFGGGPVAQPPAPPSGGPALGGGPTVQPPSGAPGFGGGPTVQPAGGKSVGMMGPPQRQFGGFDPNARIGGLMARRPRRLAPFGGSGFAQGSGFMAGPGKNRPGNY